MTDIGNITSRDNRRLADLRKLRDGAVGDRIFLEGRRLVEESLRSPIELGELYFADTFRDSQLIERIAGRVSFSARLPDKLFRSVAETRSSQGIIVTARRPLFTFDDLEEMLRAGSLPLVVLLAEINNPANLGAIARSAEAAGAAGLVVTSGSADAYSPKALRAGMGSSLRLPIVTQVEANDVFSWASTAKLTPTRTESRSPTEYTRCDWTLPRLLIFGSEGHGLRSAIMPDGGESVAIPMRNGVESLNLAVSAGIILFEARRQNG